MLIHKLQNIRISLVDYETRWTYTARLDINRNLRGIRSFVKDREGQLLIGLIEFVSVAKVLTECRDAQYAGIEWRYLGVVIFRVSWSLFCSRELYLVVDNKRPRWEQVYI